MDWINLAEDRERRLVLVNAVINLKGSIKIGEILDQLRTSQLLRKDSVSWRELALCTIMSSLMSWEMRPVQ